MKKSIIVAATLAFAIAGCGGGGKPSASGNAGSGRGSPSDAGSAGTLSPYQQQKYDSYARSVCYEIDDKNFGIGPFTFGMWLSFVKKDLNLSEADAIAFVKQVASKQCPEYLGHISQWQKE